MRGKKNHRIMQAFICIRKPQPSVASKRSLQKLTAHALQILGEVSATGKKIKKNILLQSRDPSQGFSIYQRLY